MGAVASYPCARNGSILLVAAANGELGVAQQQLQKNPRASLYHSFKDRSSPLIQASARGHFELVQLILETSVMVVGPEKAKRRCIDHSNQKQQTALMVACKHGHADCVEYLVANGANPLLYDARRHNTCLHFAALYGHSECIHKLLGSRTGGLVQDTRVAHLMCEDDEGTSEVRFIDRHNGWGLTALQIAVFQGSAHAVRALLRHGASLEAVIIPSKVENSPIRFAKGSNALHVAALVGNIVMVKLLLEAQESHPGLELRSKQDALGLRPRDYAHRARNPVLVHLLDERLPVSLLHQIWMNYSLERSLPPRHQTLEALLQKLKLMFNLEVIAVQCKIATLSVVCQAADESEQLAMFSKPSKLSGPAAAKHQWEKRQAEVQQLLSSVCRLGEQLQVLCGSDEEEGRPEGLERNSNNEAVLNFILSTVITPRTVSAILHAAKKLASSSRIVDTTAVNPDGSTPVDLPPKDPDAKHGLTLLSTALRLMDSCMQAATFLTHPSAVDNLTSSLLPAGTSGEVLAAAGLESAAGGAAASQVLGAADAAGAPLDSEETSPAAADRSGAETPMPGATPRAGASPLAARTLPNEDTGERPATLAAAAVSAADAGVTPAQDAAANPKPAASAAAAQPAGEAPASRRAELNIMASADTAAARSSQISPSAPAPASPSAAATAAAGDAAPTAGSLIGHLGEPAVRSSHGVAPLPPGMQVSGTPGDPYYPHWSSHLHTLIAQLQRDISVQRHRRRRQHAAQAAARTAASTAGSAAPASSTSNATAAVSFAPVADSTPPQPAAAVSPVATALDSDSATDAAVSLSAAQMHMSVSVPDSQVERGALQALADGTDADEMRTSRESGPAESRNDSRLLHVMSTAIAVDGMDSDAGTPCGNSSSHAAATSGIEVFAREDGWADDASPDTAQPAPSMIYNPMVSATSSFAMAAAQGQCSSSRCKSTRDSDKASDKAEKREAGQSIKALARKLDALMESTADEASDEDSKSDWSEEARAVCSICMDMPVAVQVSGCQHGLCVQCAFQLTMKGRELPCCPFCRRKISLFEPK